MSKEQYAQLPQGIWVREVKAGGRILMTTLLEPEQVSADDLAALYAMRWNIEVDFRTLKADMHMDVLRCKSPAMVQKENAVYLLTYNLVRRVMAQAVQLAGESARQFSFTGAQRLLRVFAGHQSHALRRRKERLHKLCLKALPDVCCPSALVVLSHEPRSAGPSRYRF